MTDAVASHRIPVGRLAASRTLRRAAVVAIPSVVVVTLIAGATYVAAQQLLRSSANDPQIQLAEDAAARLDAGTAPGDVVQGGTVDIAASLAPFVAVYDTAGAVLATNGRLDGTPPAPPSGVLAAARATGRDLVTWQPRAGVRIATAVVPWHGGSVLSGRSLRVVEGREDAALQLALAGWLAMLVVVGASSLVTGWAWTRLTDA